MTVTAPLNANKILTRRVFFQFATAPLKSPLAGLPCFERYLNVVWIFGKSSHPSSGFLTISCPDFRRTSDLPG
jgi:hypothetical protein